MLGHSTEAAERVGPMKWFLSMALVFFLLRRRRANSAHISQPTPVSGLGLGRCWNERL